nr:hypothetical protein [Tanacetum cinerariifolium]
MGTIDDMKSSLTQSALDALCEKFHIPRTVHPELPRHNLRIHNSPTSKIGVYTRFFDFANYQILLSQFLVDMLEYFQINLSRLSVIAAAKVSHLEILCHVHGFASTVGNFRRGRVVVLAGVNDQGDANIQDVGHDVVNEEGVDDGQENHIDASVVCVKDEVPATIVEKVKKSKKKRKSTGGSSGSCLPPKKLRVDYGTSGAGASTGGKSVAALQGLLERSTFLVEVGVMAMAIVLFVTSSVSLTPKREGGGRIDSATGQNLCTQHPTERFVVLSDSLCHSSSNAVDAEVSFVARTNVAGLCEGSDGGIVGVVGYGGEGRKRGRNGCRVMAGKKDSNSSLNVGCDRKECLGFLQY